MCEKLHSTFISTKLIYKNSSLHLLKVFTPFKNSLSDFVTLRMIFKLACLDFVPAQV